MMSLRTSTVMFIAILFASSNVFGQTTGLGKESRSRSAKAELVQAVAISKKAKDLTISTTGLMNENIEITGIVRYVAPNSYYSKGRINIVNKETIEIAGKRFDFWNDQWIHSRENLFPLYEQLSDLQLPKFTSAKGDTIRVKTFSVSRFGGETVNGEAYTVYDYIVSYNENWVSDKGKAWVNDLTKRIHRLEIVGVMGSNEAKSTVLFEYDKGLKIEPPSKYITKKWFSDK